MAVAARAAIAVNASISAAHAWVSNAATANSSAFLAILYRGQACRALPAMRFSTLGPRARLPNRARYDRQTRCPPPQDRRPRICDVRPNDVRPHDRPRPTHGPHPARAFVLAAVP